MIKELAFIAVNFNISLEITDQIFQSIFNNKRKYSPTPIVRVTVGADGKEQEEIVLISVLKKAEGDQFSQKIVELLNKDLSCQERI